MNERWEMCIIDIRSKTVYSPGVEKKYTAFDGKKYEQKAKQMGDAIKELLSDGWEPFAVSDAATSAGIFQSIHFRRRIS